MSNFDFKKYLVENKLTSNSRMLNEDNLEVKNIAKQLYSFLTKEGLKTELNVGLANARTTSIGNSELKGKPGEDMAMITYHDDPKIKQAVIYIRLGGEEERILQVEKKIGQFLPSNLEQYDRKILNQDSTNYRIEFRVKEKTTAKGGLAGNTNEGYYDDIAGYTSVSDNGTGFKDNDKVKSKSGQEGVVYDVLKSKEGKALVVVKFQNNGNTAITKYGEGFSDINDISK